MAFDFPASPSVGQQFSPAGGPTWQWDGTVWSAVPGLAVGATAQSYSRIVNGAMQISQENGTTAVTAAALYPADQWLTQVSGIVFSAAKSIGANQIYMAVTTGKALAAGDYLGFSQRIEGVRVSDFVYGTAGAAKSVLRFEVYSPIT